MAASDSNIASIAGKDEPYDKWRAESDLRSLTEAEQIKKNPVRMAHVRRAAKEKLAEMEAYKTYAQGEK